jgi:dolichol-phosphate mannosyltransferase
MISLASIFFILQAVAAGVVLRKLARGRKRRPSLTRLRVDAGNAPAEGSVTIVIPARNEAHRIQPCIIGAVRQGPEVTEILVVDDQSTDGTAEVVRALSDERVRIIAGQPLPPDWVGKPWALEQGLREAKTEWVLCLDADTRPEPGLAAAAIRAASEDNVALLFVGPRFLVETRGERWLHPALLTTLLYRLGPGDAVNAMQSSKRRRRLVSGPCFLFKADELRKNGVFAAVRHAFDDDIALAAYLEKRNVPVSFRNGTSLLEIKMYGSARETWHGWGVTIGLNESTRLGQRLIDIATLIFTQAAPLPLLLWFCFTAGGLRGWSWALLVLNALLVSVRLALLGLTARSYHPTKDLYWLSPTADIPAVLRVILSALYPPRMWRDRTYSRDNW